MPDVAAGIPDGEPVNPAMLTAEIEQGRA